MENLKLKQFKYVKYWILWDILKIWYISPEMDVFPIQILLTALVFGMN